MLAGAISSLISRTLVVHHTCFTVLFVTSGTWNTFRLATRIVPPSLIPSTREASCREQAERAWGELQRRDDEHARGELHLLDGERGCMGML